MPTRYQVVVIGSGFGGAVLASRLAQAGRTVCVLERGKEHPPNSFRRDFSPDILWDPPTRRFGFLEYRGFPNLEVIQGCGVGGGSLHYFGVSLRADIFTRQYSSVYAKQRRASIEVRDWLKRRFAWD